MNKWAKGVSERFDGLAARERWLIVLAVVGGILLIGFSLLVDPALARNRALKSAIERKTGDLANLQAQLTGLEAQLQADPDAGRKADIVRIRDSINVLDGRLRESQGAMVPPERMNAVLANVLRGHSGLRLISLTTTRPSSLLGEAEAESKPGMPADAPRFDLYRHGVEIRLEGSYLDQISYLSDLERNEPGLLWGNIRLLATEYPKTQMTVVIYTLSAEKAWLAL